MGAIKRNEKSAKYCGGALLTDRDRTAAAGYGATNVTGTTSMLMHGVRLRDNHLGRWCSITSHRPAPAVSSSAVEHCTSSPSYTHDRSH
ncbi:unnamed protein product [Pieris brassicae]|uniref:Uncharacterized protein n=1 Tax=Pieris brassicae TaxID=7116 RepID=A0A9P0TQC0_PIEBR|nr:unnamed protein product [Pieris brassicae]